jgi:hypothetical protein
VVLLHQGEAALDASAGCGAYADAFTNVHDLRLGTQVAVGKLLAAVPLRLRIVGYVLCGVHALV